MLHLIEPNDRLLAEGDAVVGPYDFVANGQETGKTFQRKMFHVLTVFFRLLRRFLLDPVIRAIGF